MGKALASWESFRTEISEREQELASMLPRHVSRERFINSSVAAVKQNPELLQCTPRSMMTAITRSAQDGILPDGREGVITAYKEKQKDNSWKLIAQWNPMTHGLRKRAREIDEIIVDAQVVYENDHFEWNQGDAPGLIHKPATLGVERGKMLGAYAIFKRGDEILHREVMTAFQIEQVRAQSKQPNGLLWSKFTSEAWRKTVIRRGFKSVPCSERLETILHRDDDAFEFSEPEQPKMRVVSATGNGAGKPLPPVAGVPAEFTNGDSDDVPADTEAAESGGHEPEEPAWALPPNEPTYEGIKRLLRDAASASDCAEIQTVNKQRIANCDASTRKEITAMITARARELTEADNAAG